MNNYSHLKLPACILTLVLCLFACTGEKSNDISVMTLNIRCDTPGDGINSWINRAPIAAGFICESAPDLLGLQEVMWNQYQYLDSTLSGYESVLPCGPEGFKKGIANPVFYSRSRFKSVSSGIFWLSPTPDIEGSTGWGAAYPRTVTWVKLFDKTAKDTILFLNTHFDHKSDSARINGASVLFERLGKLAYGNDFIITGDLNALPESPTLLKIQANNPIKNARLISETKPSGTYDTYNAWSYGQGKGRIDYILVRDGISVRSYQSIKVIKDSVFISDHWPVIATISCGKGFSEK